MRFMDTPAPHVSRSKYSCRANISQSIPFCKEQFKIGEALKGLGQEDILVIGSGVTVHNLRALKWNQTTPEKWAIEFDDWIIKHMQHNDKDVLFIGRKMLLMHN